MFLYHPREAKNKPWELQTIIDQKQYGIDTTEAHALFHRFWNDSVTDVYPDAMITTFDMQEWRWALGPLRQACRRAFSESLRMQLESVDVKDQRDHVPDHLDDQHAYTCAGVVFHHLRKHFKRNTSIQGALTQVLLTHKQAADAKLPVAEILSK